MTGHPGLQVVRTWLFAMHRQDILYCHFKSNAHVVDGLVGITDLDILVDRAGYSKAVELLFLAGFKRFQTSKLMDYPAVEDYIGLDWHTGKLVHLHLHWQLVVGEPNLKGYRLPWENLFLNGRIWDERGYIYIAAHEHELLLLLTRITLKVRLRDRLKILLGKSCFNKGLNDEYEWLVTRVDRKKFYSLVQDVLGKGIAGQIKSLLTYRKLTNRDIFTIKNILFNSLQKYRTYCAHKAIIRRWRRELSKLYFFIARRFGQPREILRRFPAGGGLVVALLGVDGSGKSTHCKGLVRWLGWKADVMSVYLGSGDGPSSLSRKVLTIAKKLVLLPRLIFFPQEKKINTAENSIAAESWRTSSKFIGSKSFAYKIWLSLWGIALAREKMVKLKKAFQARNLGMIVITDRYPQSQVLGFNDGPLLNDLKNEWPWSVFSRYEARKYQELRELSPDLVIKLEVSVETALLRKQDTPREMAHLKVQALQSLTFGSQTKVVTIDAKPPLDSVGVAVKRAVWDVI